MAKATQVTSSGVVHVYSTLANSQRFVDYDIPPADTGRLPVEKCNVVVKGGAGIADKHLLTPQGIYTQITEAEYNAIKDLQHFKDFVDRGLIRVERKHSDIDKIVGDMNPRDPGGPLTPSDYERQAKDGTVPIPTEYEKTGTGWVAQQLASR